MSSGVDTSARGCWRGRAAPSPLRRLPFGTWCYLGLLVTGTAMYVTGSRLEGPRRGLAVIAVAYAIASVLISEMDLNRMVVWQAPVAVVALGACSALLFTLPPSRRSLGSMAGG